MRPIAPILPDTITAARDRVVAALLKLDPDVRQAVLNDWTRHTIEVSSFGGDHP